MEILATAGLFQYQIAAQMKMDEDTLVKYYEYELNAGWASNMKKATDVIIKRIEEDGEEAMEAAKFFLARRGKGLWSEQKNVEISGPNGGAIPVAQINLDVLDYDDLEAMESLLDTALIEHKPDAVQVDDEDDEADDRGA